MKVLEFDNNKARIAITSMLDLWHLQQIVEKGDSITAKTLRTIFVKREEEKVKGEKKFVLLTIKLEKIEFDEHKSKLRMNGKIVEAPEEVQKGDYHTIEIGLGNSITIEKEMWKQEQLERLDRAKIKIEVADNSVLENFFVHLNKDDRLTAYGIEQVKIAAEIGAVKIVLVPEDKIRDKVIEEVVKIVESKRGEVKLVLKKGFMGKKFCEAYNIAAVLRFPIS